ncbi:MULTISPECIES: FAD-binding oxidoreductase [Bartonella]|uniref:FAD-binding oxidoreductase n=1 Tax=Bartonella TaxID=773 RepID=UPI0018DCD1D9|nr:FAD-binding oxidoreductase [Bartonella sp. P0291]MBH9996799.1 FAD-binding oxidoreductase [Bartonella sp. M0192]MBH9998959.1 FAD-binding oxidoreductase [Bartonella sp. M0191]MBI0007338.1 FAD-binding oxidoreductase [Bartonella sp. M0193]MBI0010250.1 FAD-binding oxidoreductase [Bartonella sp. M0176]MBI0012629.1 FAD-binding oxidoreductase [Bartonella apihabitans]
MDKKLIERFIEIVGVNHALVDQDVISSYLVEQRGLYHGRTPLVLRPSSPKEVSEIMKLASATGTPIVPQGGNTGLVGAQQPDESATEIIVSMERLNRIRSIDVEGNLALVEAGVVLQTLQEKVDKKGRFFPLSLGSEGSCQIGGNLSSNAGGTDVLAYGNTRELCLGLEVVLPDGRILDDLRYVKKDNSGYDLKDLFIGAEGTLGIITAAVMKLFPKPQGKAVAYAGMKSPEKALELLLLAQKKAGSMLTGFELMAKVGMEMSLNYVKGARAPLEHESEWYVLLDLSSSHSDGEANNTMEDILSDALQQGIIEDASIARSVGQQKEFWRLREDMSPAQKLEGGSIKHDISVPIASIPDFISEAAKIIETIAPGARIVCFGHMGDGNLHYNVSQPVGADKLAYLSLWGEMNHRIHTLVMSYNGSFSAEHGIGQLKRKELVAFKSPVALSLMRSIKQLFDPKNIMNPGKML